jgi:hypothetical protein
VREDAFMEFSYPEPMTSLVLQMPEGMNPDSTIIIPDGQAPVYLHLDHDADENGSAYSSLAVFNRPVSHFILYTHKLFGELQMHMLYAPSVSTAIIQELRKKSSAPCEKPQTIDQSVWRNGLNPPTVPPTATKVLHVIVHHTDTPNSDSNYVNEVRNIYLYHTQVHGWDDIGYNYLIAPDGTIFDGRDGQNLYEDDNVKGAHLCAKNNNTMGISMIGTFSSVRPTDTAMTSLRMLISWKLNKENLDPLDSSLHPVGDPEAQFLGVIAGHRDGCATECPGDSLYALLPKLRKDVDSANKHCSTPVASVRPVQKLNDLQVYPQPARDYIIIPALGYNIGDNYNWFLFDMQGRRLNAGHISSGEDTYISLASFPKGSYVLTVPLDERLYRKIIIKE